MQMSEMKTQYLITGMLVCITLHNINVSYTISINTIHIIQ